MAESTQVSMPIARLSKLVVIILYGMAIIAGFACTLWTALVLIVIGGMSKWDWDAIPLLVIAFTSAFAYSILVVKVITTEAWHRHMYKPLVWVPILLYAATLFYGNYQFAQYSMFFRGF